MMAHSLPQSLARDHARTVETVAALNRLHQVLGARAPCTWADYLESAPVLCGADPAVMGALARLGWFWIDPDGVTWRGR
jgi:hypothetical protein